ncbi:MAG: phospholipase D family protein, partial [Gammaproteobacteria bacterium]|nr:phospholipase D family protein [Gammaproteobacteria bacterium]
YHNECFSTTFHPKVYILEHENEKAAVFTGSANLTAGGMFTNYEAIELTDYDLQSSRDRERYEQVKCMVASYMDVNSTFCKRLNDDLLQDLIRLNYIANEEVTSNRNLGRAGLPRDDQPDIIFGSAQVSLPPQQIEPVEHDTSGEQQNVQRDSFWKVLSRNDMSSTSSPGQIIIPKRFLTLFPPFSEWVTTAVGARQAEVFFNILLTKKNGESLRITGVRAIHYIPAAHHPRPNQELRFTFRTREYFQWADEGDILLFSRTQDPSVWFTIQIVAAGCSQAQQLRQSGGRFGIVH